MRHGNSLGSFRRIVPAVFMRGRAPLGTAQGIRFARTIASVAACVLFGALGVAAQEEHIFKGQICQGPGIPAALFAPNLAPAQCTTAPHKRRAHYVLTNPAENIAYQLDGHKIPRDFAGSDVFVVGSLDADSATIHVDDIYRALPPKVTKAKSVYIDCDSCVRGMAAAWLAAFEQLSDWGRFDVVPDRKKADLILLLSANPYLGDFVTRDGPDKRPVKVDITYMNVVDPRTGESFWDDSRQWGALFVARATKDLIGEFKDEFELEAKAGTAPSNLIVR